MLLRIAPVLLLLLLLTAVFVFFRLVRKHNRWRWVWLVPHGVLLGSLIGLCCTEDYSPGSLWATGVFVCAFLCWVVPWTVAALFWCVGAPGRNSSVWRRCWELTGEAVGFVLFGALLYGSIWGWRRFEVKEITVASADLPAEFDGYRLVQLSDLHVGTIGAYPEVVRRLVELVNAQEADAILFTGDLVNHRAEELDGVQEILAGLRAHDGVFSVMGNHDYSMYLHWGSEEERLANVEELRRREAAMGWRMLVNEHVMLRRDSAVICIAGVENRGLPPFPQLGDLKKALSGTDGHFTVLMSHDPTHWREEVLPQSGVQLTLSGHTHAMQLMVGDWTPSAWFYPENHGLYQEGERSLYVNIGVGQVMLPFRLGAWPEISVITLQKK